jgi:hypothetical protein
VIASFIGIAVVAGVTGFLFWERHDRCKALIEADLRRYHFTEIQISIDWGSLDRYTMSYDVSYVSADNVRRRNHCDILLVSGRDNEVHWSTSIAPAV